MVPTISILLLFSMDSSSEASSAETRFGVCGAGRVVFTPLAGEGRVGCLRPDWILSKQGRGVEVVVRAMGHLLDGSGPELLTSSSQDGQAGGVIWFSRKKDWNR